MAALAEATNSEPGCLDFRYGTVTGGGLPAHLIAERYDGRAAFEAHGEQEHTRAYAAALPGLLADSATFNILTAGRHETLTVQAAGLFAGGRLPIVGYSA